MDLLLELPLNPTEMMAAIAIITVGATVQASAGFGLGLVSAPVLLLIEPALVPGPLLAAGLTMALLISVRDRAGIDVKGLRAALLGRVVGIIPAVFILAAISPKIFGLIFAALVLTAVVLSLLGLSIKPTPKRIFCAGAISGLMATISSIGGPPMALMYQRSQGMQLRGTLSGYFTVGAILSLIALTIGGQVGWHEAKLALMLLPGIGLGFLLSLPLAAPLEEAGTRPLVLVLSSCSAIAVLLRTAFI